MMTYISSALGRGATNQSIITSAIFTMITFLYIYTLASYSKVLVHYLLNRQTHEIVFTNVYIFNEYIDHILISFGTTLWFALSIKGKAKFVILSAYSALIIVAITVNLGILLDFLALSSVPIIISCWIYNSYILSKKKSHTILSPYTNTLFVRYISITGIILGFASLIVTLVLHFQLIQPESIPLRNYAYDMFVLFGCFSPILFFLLISSFPIKLLINSFINISRLKINNNILNGSHITSRKKIVYLSLFMLLSIAIVLIPHIPIINKNNQQVGSDTQIYMLWVDALLKSSNNPQKFLQDAFVTQQGGDRPISLIFLFAIVKIVNNPNLSFVIESTPVIMAPALVLVIYLLTREITSNDFISLLSAFLTAVSFHILIGMYAGLYANWLGLVIGNLSIVFLIRYLNRPDNKIALLIIFFVLVVVLQFTHAYTWTIFTIVIGVFLLTMLKFKYYHNKKKVIFLLLIVLSSIIIDVGRITILKSSGGIEQDLSVAKESGVGLKQFTMRWDNLIYTTQIYFVGLFSNFIFLLLGLYWLFRSNLQEPSTILLIIFLSTGFLPLFFGDVVIQARIFYDIPFQIPAAIALSFIMRYSYGNLTILSICLWVFAFAFRSAFNLNQ